MSAGWRLPGYEVLELIGFGGSGEVWRAREQDTGEVVALKRLHAAAGGADAVARERLRREAAVLSSVAGEHVVRVRDVVLTDTEAVLVMDYAAGGNLETVLAVRGRLAGPEVVTLVAPLAGALADAHDRGIIHGDVTPANIVFAADGRPLLTDFGVARAVGSVPPALEATPGYLAPEVLAGQPAAPAADVYALCRVAVTALGADGAPEQLLAAVQAGLADDPHDRPTARRLASDVLHACAAAPVGLVRAAAVPPAAVTHTVRPTAVVPEPSRPPARGRRRRPRRRPRVPQRLLVSALAAGVLVLAIAGGVVWGHRTQSSAAVLPRTAAVPTTPSVDWRAVVDRLGGTRARAFNADDAGLLRDIYATGSAALAADEAALRRLDTSQLHAEGFAITTLRVVAMAQTATSATLSVTDELSSYVLRGVHGETTRIPARPARTFVMVLTHDGGDWRISGIRR